MARKILVVEDSVTQSEHLRLLLETEGYQVEVAANGHKGLQRVQAAPPDLIISDILMPEMDGYQFCQAVKSSARTRHIPFAILTVLKSPADVVIGLERGADNFITKPFADDYLLERVRRIFENLDLAQADLTTEGSLVQVGDRKILVSSQKQQIVELLMAVLHELGRVNNVMVESQQTLEMYQRKITAMDRIREGLEQDRFTLHFQPIVDLRRNEATSSEMLLRFKGEGGQLLGPGQFLPLAEESGMIAHVDEWVVRQAIDLLTERPRRDLAPGVSVNLSRRSLMNRQLMRTIERELVLTGINPEQLTFEITETAIMANMSEVAHRILDLQALGCLFALDDFGAGYSTFDHLRHLPVNSVKIDGSFIQGLPKNRVNQRLVKAMVEVAHAMGRTVVAEFVEDEETLQMVRHYGVDSAQGYYIGRPGPDYPGPIGNYANLGHNGQET